MSEYPRPPYKLSPIPLTEEQERHIKAQSGIEDRSIAAIIRRMIDRDIKLKAEVA